MIDFKKIKLVQAIIFLCTVVGLVLQFMQNRKIEQDNLRLKGSLLSIHSSVKKIQLKDNSSAFESKVLSLKLDELQTLYPELLHTVKSIGVKPRLASQLTQLVLKDSLSFRTFIRDSTIYDTIRVRVFHFSNAFYTVKALELNDTAHVSIENRDTLFQVIHYGKRIKPWLWFFSKRELTQTVKLANPSASLVYSKHIILPKK